TTVGFPVRFGMTTSSLAPGTVLVSQLAASFQLNVPAPPSQVTIASKRRGSSGSTRRRRRLGREPVRERRGFGVSKRRGTSMGLPFVVDLGRLGENTNQGRSFSRVRIAPRSRDRELAPKALTRSTATSVHAIGQCKRRVICFSASQVSLRSAAHAPASSPTRSPGRVYPRRGRAGP